MAIKLKQYIFRLFILMLFIGSVQAAECNVKLKDQDNYSDLNTILKCLYEKIVDVERVVFAAQAERIIPIKSIHRSYENEEIIILITKAVIDEGAVSMSMKFENKSKKPLVIYMRANNTSIVDEYGEKWRHYSNSILDSSGRMIVNPDSPRNAKFVFKGKSKLSGNQVNLESTLRIGAGSSNYKHVTVNQIILENANN
ncbi:MAG: hypothetical protein FE835_19320 [Gammaproteobacteria bacterium]|nr:hypothetical protein [Gammaproteobacteria bacterium]